MKFQFKAAKVLLL